MANICILSLKKLKYVTEKNANQCTKKDEIIDK